MFLNDKTAKEVLQGWNPTVGPHMAQNQRKMDQKLCLIFCDDDVPITIIRDNSKIQTRKTWSDNLRCYWLKEKLLNTYHKNQNLFEHDKENRKADMIKITID